MESIKSLLGKYEGKKVKSATRLKFEGIQDLDVYNITSPFKVKRSWHIIGRVEMRDDEMGTKVIFFKKKGRKWVIDFRAPIFNLQDPFVSKIEDMLVVGGVEVKRRSIQGKIHYRMVFYKGSDIYNLRRFSTGPWGMKDIRFSEMADGRICIFTRPQGKRGGKGKIGYVFVKNLNDVSPRKLSCSKIVKDQFVRGEWGGVNEAHLLKDGKIGILGHVAKYSKNASGERLRYYYPVTFSFDPESESFSKMKIVAVRNEIPKGHSKRPDLYNVIFPGGLIRDGYKSKLFVGVGDAEAYKLIIDDPFNEYEEE